MILLSLLFIGIAMPLFGQVLWVPAREADEATLVATLGENYRELGELLEWGIIVKSAPKPILALGGTIGVRSRNAPPVRPAGRMRFSREISGPYGYDGFAIRPPVMLLGKEVLGPGYPAGDVQATGIPLLVAQKIVVEESPVLDFVLFVDGTTWGEDQSGGLRKILERPKAVRQLLAEFQAAKPEERAGLLERARGDIADSPWRSWAAQLLLAAENQEEAIQRLQKVENRWRKEP